MIHQRSGFSIIEMIISIMISAILMTGALTIYNQISKGAVSVQRVTQLDTQMMILHNRLASDLQGLSPLWFTPELYEKLKKEGKDDSQEKQTTSTQPTGNNKRNNFLYAQSTDNQFNLLTFITTNALQVYGDINSRIVRVVYLLQPDAQYPGTFKLMRKQDDTISSDFDLEKISSGTLSQIAHHITNCSVEYGFVDHAAEEKSKDSANKAAPTFKFVSQWGNNDQAKEKNEKTPSLPDVIKLTITIQYFPEQEAKTYELLCTIPTSQTTATKSFAQKRLEEQRQAQKQSPQGPSGASKGDGPPGTNPQGGTPQGGSPQGGSPQSGHQPVWRKSGSMPTSAIIANPGTKK